MRTLFDFLVHEVLIIAQWRYRIFLLAVVIFILLLFSVRSMFLFAIAGIHVMSTCFFSSLLLSTKVWVTVCVYVWEAVVFYRIGFILIRQQSDRIDQRFQK